MPRLDGIGLRNHLLSRWRQAPRPILNSRTSVHRVSSSVISATRLTTRRCRSAGTSVAGANLSPSAVRFAATQAEYPRSPIRAPNAAAAKMLPMRGFWPIAE